MRDLIDRKCQMEGGCLRAERQWGRRGGETIARFTGVVLASATTAKRGKVSVSFCLDCAPLLQKFAQLYDHSGGISIECCGSPKTVFCRMLFPRSVEVPLG